MANPIPETVVTGTIGELLVQMRLLQYGVQSAAPLKDSGNDLIALKGFAMRAIQVKTCTDRFRTPLVLPEMYHVVALVKLCWSSDELLLDTTKIYLVPKNQISNLAINNETVMMQFAISQQIVDHIFTDQ